MERKFRGITWQETAEIIEAVEQIYQRYPELSASDLLPPSPMALAQLAATLDPALSKSDHHAALQQAAVFFVRSLLFGSDLLRLPHNAFFSFKWADDLFFEIARRRHQSFLASEQTTSLKLFPKGTQQDRVCEFLGVKTPRTVINDIKEFILVTKRKDRPEQVAQDELTKFFDERRGTDSDGKEYFWLGKDFLSQLRDYRRIRKQTRKREGGLKSIRTRPKNPS